MQSFEFHPVIAEWFQQRFGSPTEPQIRGWPAIQTGRPTLIAAPTGSGKTLAAFLAALDRLFREGLAGTLRDETSVVYVSPLKALSNDIHKNLEEPLKEIGEAIFAREGRRVLVRAEVRTGDTPALFRANDGGAKYRVGMATSTKSTSRARNTPARGGSTGRKPAANTAAQKTVKYPSAEPKPGLLVLETEPRFDILIHPGHDFLASTGCINLTEPLADGDADIAFVDSRDRVIAAINDLKAFAGEAFPQLNGHAIANAWIVIDGEP